MKILIFHIYFCNMDISLIIALICLIICMYIPYMYMEGKVSQIFDKGLSSCFIVYRRWKLEKIYKKSQKLPVFCHKIKTKAKTENLRHLSLDENVVYIHSKVGRCK